MPIKLSVCLDILSFSTCSFSSSIEELYSLGRAMKPGVEWERRTSCLTCIWIYFVFCVTFRVFIFIFGSWVASEIFQMNWSVHLGIGDKLVLSCWAFIWTEPAWLADYDNHHWGNSQGFIEESSFNKIWAHGRVVETSLDCAGQNVEPTREAHFWL